MTQSSASSTSGNPDKIVSVSLFVPAPADKIFELLADPRRHKEIDGSGSVRESQVNAPQRLFLGAQFGMNMRIGLPYKITNTVVEFEEGRRIAWRHFGGHIWRYILEPADGGTRVTEQFDWNTNKSPLMLKVMNAIPRNKQAMEKTLQNMVDLFS